MSESVSSRFWWRLCGSLLACGLALNAQAAGAGFGEPVNDSSLDRVRGGFSVGTDGIALNVAVQQSVFVNGTLTASSNVQFAQSASQVSGSASGGALVQIGAANSATLVSTGPASASAVIQNSLDNQNIQTLTNVTVSATIMNAYRAMNLQAALSSAITNSLRH